MYETIYITSHKQPCRALAFAADGALLNNFCCKGNNLGSLVASGSADCSIKVVDVDRIIARDMTPEEIAAAVATGFESDAAAVKLSDAPVVRTLYDHTDVRSNEHFTCSYHHLQEVTCLQFHPKLPLLISGSSDTTIKLFDYSKPAVKRAYRLIQVESEFVANLQTACRKCCPFNASPFTRAANT
jgi:cleavage stimulation factor subunit 1